MSTSISHDWNHVCTFCTVRNEKYASPSILLMYFPTVCFKCLYSLLQRSHTHYSTDFSRNIFFPSAAVFLLQKTLTAASTATATPSTLLQLPIGHSQRSEFICTLFTYITNTDSPLVTYHRSEKGPERVLHWTPTWTPLSSLRKERGLAAATLHLHRHPISPLVIYLRSEQGLESTTIERPQDSPLVTTIGARPCCGNPTSPIC